MQSKAAERAACSFRRDSICFSATGVFIKDPRVATLPLELDEVVESDRLLVTNTTSILPLARRNMVLLHILFEG